MNKSIVAICLLISGCATTGKTTYNRDQVKAVISKNMKKFRTCYSEFTLVSKSKAGGKLELNWDIIEDGKVENIMVVKSVEPILDQCISRALSKIQFQEPPSGQIIRVTYPFSFVYKEKDKKSTKK